MSSDEEDVFINEEMPPIEEEPAPIEEKTNKKGKHKKPMSDERKKQLLENLKKGREKSLAKRQAKAQLKREKPKEELQEVEAPKPKRTIEKKQYNNREIDYDTKERIYNEMKRKKEEQAEHRQLTNDIKDLKEKLNWLVNDMKGIKDKELKKEVKQEIKELKEEIKQEQKKPEPAQRPKTPPAPIIEEEKPKTKMWCPIRGNYYI